MYKVVYRKLAIKTLEKLPIQLSNHFMLAFNQVASGADGDLDIKKLTGREGLGYQLVTTVLFIKKLMMLW